MDSNSLLKSSIQVVQELVAKAQRSHRLPAMNCTWDNLHTALPFDTDLAKTKLSYLFRQPEYPQSSMQSNPKESISKLLLAAYQWFREPVSPKPLVSLSQQVDSHAFLPMFLSSMLSDRVALAALIKPDGSKKWFAQATPGRQGNITSITYGVKGIEFIHSPTSALSEKGISLLAGTQKDVKDLFMRENSVPPSPAACNQLIESIACQIILPLSMSMDKQAIRMFVEQFPDEPYPHYQILPKSTSNQFK